jgi:hypothetical protein
LPPALAGVKISHTEKALAKPLRIWLKPFGLNYSCIQLKLEAIQFKNFAPEALGLRLCEINSKTIREFVAIKNVTIYHTNHNHKKRTFKYLSKL